MGPVLILGIETSCDETAAAVTEGARVLSDVVHSQVSLHAEYGGVVPEIASRDHLRNIQRVVSEALSAAGKGLSQMDAIAVTKQPGLSGALLIGSQVAQTLAWAEDKRLVGVDHLVGHLLAVFLEFEAPPAEVPSFPFVGLLASGGHTGIYLVEGPTPDQISEIGGTRDDAAGEAFDKVAKLLGLGYPGGPVIDRLAAEGDPTKIELARPMAQKKVLEFSFSGLKTNVMRWVRNNGIPKNDQTLRDLCAALQSRIVESLIDKAIVAARENGVKEIVLAGGVAANSGLRSYGASEGERHGFRVIAPSKRACTDNAAMIAHAGSFLAAKGIDERGSLTIQPRTNLPRATRKGKGPRASL